ncbi:hypothetical protein AB5I41_11730 [Sphingomonas sp. MMS24-JH45]
MLDIGFSGLGLGGNASGTLALAVEGGAPPTGRIDMTVRGLTRSGLLLTSAPIDLGVTGILTADRAGFRAVMASGGRTVGRAQALLRPLGSGDGGGDLVQRLRAGPLFALKRTPPTRSGSSAGRIVRPDRSGRDRGRCERYFASPQIRGVLRASGGRLQSAVTGTNLTEVKAPGRFTGSRLQIDRFTAKAGRAGSVSGSGSFDFAAPAGVGIDLTAERATPF